MRPNAERNFANRDRRFEQESFPFRLAVVADREIFHYSTDFPGGSGGMEVLRDLDRDDLISDDSDRDGIPDPMDTAVNAVAERIGFEPVPRIAASPTHTGNTCTEDLVALLEECGVNTGIDLTRLIETGHRAEEILDERLRANLIRSGPVRHEPIAYTTDAGLKD